MTLNELTLNLAIQAQGLEIELDLARMRAERDLHCAGIAPDWTADGRVDIRPGLQGGQLENEVCRVQ